MLLQLHCRLQPDAILQQSETAKTFLKALIVVKVDVFLYCAFQILEVMKRPQVEHLNL